MESAARCEGADRSCRSSITRSIRPDCHPGRLAPIWQAAEHFLRANGNRTIPVAEIYDLWRKPPFGVKDGLMPVLAVGLATPLAGHDVHALQLKVLRGETRGSRAMLRGCGLAPDKTFNQGVPGSNPGGLTISRHSPARFFRAPCLSSSRTPATFPDNRAMSLVNSSTRWQHEQVMLASPSGRNRGSAIPCSEGSEALDQSIGPRDRGRMTACESPSQS